MLLGRAAELEQLKHYYDRDGSQIVVIYGQKNIGKTALVKEFAAGKPSCYYLARSCSEREQTWLWGRELAGWDEQTMQYPTYQKLLQAAVKSVSGKQVIIIDEFQHIIKTGSTFMRELVSFVRENRTKQKVLVILCSSSVGWVENSMLLKIGEYAYELSGLLKLKELKFSDMAAFFPHFTQNQCAECYAVLGGIPGLWTHFSDQLSIKENIIRNILPVTGSLSSEAVSAVSDELRETAVYNTILASLAGGMCKLNDLHKHTGFSRAKISVYLKNLMELEIVEKVFSAQKGVYRISHHFVFFYYRFLYPHMSSLHMSSLQADGAEEFYDKWIAPGLSEFTSVFFTVSPETRKQ